jgi:hypothetical protein
MTGPGDCGSWVVDARHGALYGVIVATSTDAQESYLVPARDIFDSIRAKWGVKAVELFSSTDVDEEGSEGMTRRDADINTATGTGSGSYSTPYKSTEPKPTSFSQKLSPFFYCCSCGHGPQLLYINPGCGNCGATFCPRCRVLSMREFD